MHVTFLKAHPLRVTVGDGAPTLPFDNHLPEGSLTIPPNQILDPAPTPA